MPQNEERKRILNLVASGKVSSDEAEGLLAALDAQPEADTTTPAGGPLNPKYLRVLVEGYVDDHGGGKVNVRVPISLIRAGVRLAALLPTGVYDHVNKALKESGLDFDVSRVKPENLEELVEHLRDLTVDVEGNKGEKVRVFCE